MAKYTSFEDLLVMKKALSLGAEIIKVFKTESCWSFRDQIIRSAISIGSNIAEGAERNSPKEFCQFIGIAKGSTAELRFQLQLALEVGFINKEKGEALIQEATIISAMLEKLRQYHAKKSLKPKS